MRLRCYPCGRSVSTEVPDETVVRACLFCPECLERGGLRRYTNEIGTTDWRTEDVWVPPFPAGTGLE